MRTRHTSPAKWRLPCGWSPAPSARLVLLARSSVRTLVVQAVAAVSLARPGPAPPSPSLRPLEPWRPAEPCRRVSGDSARRKPRCVCQRRVGFSSRSGSRTVLADHLWQGPDYEKVYADIAAKLDNIDYDGAVGGGLQRRGLLTLYSQRHLLSRLRRILWATSHPPRKSKGNALSF